MDPSLFSEMHEAIDKLLSHDSVSEDDIKSLQESIFTDIIPQFNEAIVLTDILGVSRSSLFNSINNGLIDKIKSEIEVKSDKLAEKRKQKLWSKLMRSGHKYIHHPVMQPLIMHVMGKMNNAKNYVHEILKSKELYEKTPLNVLRHVWLDHPEKLKEEIDLIIDKYISNVTKKYHSQCEEAILKVVSEGRKVYNSSTLSNNPYIMSNIVDRRSVKEIQKVVDMTGENKQLCEQILKIIQDRFLEGQMKKETLLTLHYISTLFFDVVSKLPQKLFDDNADIHSLINQLSSCVRARFIDNTHCIDLCKQLHDKQHLSRELEFICTDPFILYTTAMTILSATVDSGLNKKKLPRQVPKVSFLCSLMSYGLVDFDSDINIDRMSTSLKPLSFSIVKKRSDILDSDGSKDSSKNSITILSNTSTNYGWSKDEIVETLVINVLPNVQVTHVSAIRDKVCTKRNKIQTSMLTRTIIDPSASTTKHALVSTQYLSNPLGRLIIQYHCLWCLQKKEYFVLKLLLTAVNSSRRADYRPTVEWRPELLQALVFGICAVQNTNEKMMLDFLGLLRTVIPQTSTFYQLLFCLTIAPLKEPGEIERLLESYFKSPSTDLETSVGSGSGRSLRDITEIIIKGYYQVTSSDGQIQTYGTLMHTQANTPIPGIMASGMTPGHMTPQSSMMGSSMYTPMYSSSSSSATRTPSYSPMYTSISSPMYHPIINKPMGPMLHQQQQFSSVGSTNLPSVTASMSTCSNSSTSSPTSNISLSNPMNSHLR